MIGFKALLVVLTTCADEANPVNCTNCSGCGEARRRLTGVLCLKNSQGKAAQLVVLIEPCLFQVVLAPSSVGSQSAWVLSDSDSGVRPLRCLLLALPAKFFHRAMRKDSAVEFPVQSVMLSMYVVFGLPRFLLCSIFPRIMSLVREHLLLALFTNGGQGDFYLNHKPSERKIFICSILPGFAKN
ncbi:hypothetical protein RRG08_037253 [Elysia crispata]|uniref:Secreted protein n=1 Tax=Elysia crispata TaxID=231223 RepID=A0AAE0YMU4_9GAST|nr:hypothetical protein RRG08_037253 [Elysia crispata]